MLFHYICLTEIDKHGVKTQFCVGQYPTLIINVLEDAEYMESLYTKMVGIKTEQVKI